MKAEAFSGVTIDLSIAEAVSLLDYMEDIDDDLPHILAERFKVYLAAALEEGGFLPDDDPEPDGPGIQITQRVVPFYSTDHWLSQNGVERRAG